MLVLLMIVVLVLVLVVSGVDSTGVSVYSCAACGDGARYCDYRVCHVNVL